MPARLILVKIGHLHTCLIFLINRSKAVLSLPTVPKEVSKLRSDPIIQIIFWTSWNKLLANFQNPEHHHHQSLNCKGCWRTTDDFATSFLHFSLFSTALWDLANSRPVHSLMLSSHLFLCLPCLLPPFTVPCKMVLARPDERET